jgi:RNA polymerase sigma factor (sigma-70 family)
MQIHLLRRDYRYGIPAPTGKGSNVMTAVQDWGIVGPDSSDAELALAAAAGNRGAFAEIYDRFADRLHDFCAGMLADRDAAADCVQDAFIEAVTCLSDLREPEKLRAWLYGIARHRCLRRLRDRRREQPSDALPEIASPEAGPDALASRTELADLIAEAAGGLSDRDRSVLELSYRHGLDGPELADALGVSQTNANTMVYRLRETMERCLGSLLVCRRARTNPNRCSELATILHGWDGQFTILMRKRIARHIDDCAVCEEERRRLLNPVALLGAAPVFLPAPDWLRDKTLNQIQLTSAGTDMTAEARSGDGSFTDGPTERIAPPTAGAALQSDHDEPTVRFEHDEETVRFAPGSDDAEDGDGRDRSRMMLLLAVLIGVPLVALGLTIVVLYLPGAVVAPSGDTDNAPAFTDGDPAGPPPAGVVPQTQPADVPRNPGPAVIPQPAQPISPAPPGVLPARPGPPVVKSQQPLQAPQQPRSLPPRQQQRNAPAPAPAEQGPVEPGPAELPPPAPAPAQEAPAPDPAQPPVPLPDQARLKPRHSPPASEGTTTVPYPR